VCSVELNDHPDPEQSTMGTGFLVGPDVLLTNYHVLQRVIEEQHPAAAVRFRFDYQTTTAGTRSDGIQVELLGATDPTRPWLVKSARYSAGELQGTPDSPPPADGELDYALVRLARAIGNEPVDGEPRGWVFVPETQPYIEGIPYLLILQHPERKPLKLALDTAPKVQWMFDGLRVRYSVNTERGSSGSPVFDKDWTLLALHHYGDPAWKAGYNQGIPVSRIRQHLGELAGVLGAATPPTSRLELASAAIDALNHELQGGAAPKPAQLMNAVETATNAVFVAGFVSRLSENVRKKVEDRLSQADRKLADAIESASKPGDLARAADQFKKSICGILRFVKSVDGGELPEDLYPLWEKHGCS
jgi:hypothetical protein